MKGMSPGDGAPRRHHSCVPSGPQVWPSWPPLNHNSKRIGSQADSVFFSKMNECLKTL